MNITVRPLTLCKVDYGDKMGQIQRDISYVSVGMAWDMGRDSSSASVQIPPNSMGLDPPNMRALFLPTPIKKYVFLICTRFAISYTHHQCHV